ncbi:uncharacterized protein ACIQIH_006699 isoform 1-T1 [Cyanocitta cristata]
MSCVALVLEWERPLGALAGAAPKGNRGNPGGGGGKRCRWVGGIPGKWRAAEAARTELEAGSSRQRTPRTATSPSRTAGMSCVALVLEWERPLGALAGAAPKGNRGNPGGGGGKRCRWVGGIPGKWRAAEAARTELEAGSSRQRTPRTATSPSRTAGMSCVALVLEWERPLGALAGAGKSQIRVSTKQNPLGAEGNGIFLGNFEGLALGLGWWELSEKREGNCNVQLHSWRKDQDGRGKAVELLGARGKQKDLSTQRQQRESWRRRWKTLSLGWWNSWEMESSRSSKNRVGSRLQPAKNIQNCHLPLTDSRNVLHSSCFGMGMAVGSSGRTSGETFKQEVLKRTGASAR